MMRWIVASSLRSRGLVVALGVGMLLFGVTQLRDMPRDALPEFSPPTVEIQTEALGLSAQETEQLITVPLEQDLLNGVAFLKSIKSESLPGMSRIEMIFEPGTDINKARQVVNERLTQAFALPNVSTPPQMLQPRSSTSRVMMIRLSSKDRSLLELGLLARWTIRPQLMGIEGVSNVSMWGHRDQQLQVQVDPARLQAEGVTLEQIIRTTGNALWVSPLTFLEASTPGAGGFYDTSTQRIGVEHSQPITTPDALAQVILEGESAAPTGGEAAQKRLGDVTTVVEDHQPLIGDAVFPDGAGGLLIVVEKLPNANALDLTERLDAALEDLGPGLAGVEVDSSFFRPAQYIEDSSDNLRMALIIGAVLAVLALGALVLQLRTALVSLVSIALSLSAAVALLSFRGETLNAMVLAGLVLALAVVIDDAVSSAYAISRAVDRKDDNGKSTASRLAAGVFAVRRPLFYGTVMLLVAILPVLVLTGEPGAFMPPVVLSYAGAILASTLVALTVTPALSLLLLGNASRENRTSPIVDWIQPRYDRLTTRLTRGAKPGLIVLGALLLVGAIALPFLDRGDSVVPTFKDRDVLIHFKGAPGTSLSEMSRITARAGQELKELPGIQNVGGHVGRAVLGDQTVNVDSSEIWVRIEDEADYDKTLSSIEETVNGYPGIDKSVLTYARDRIDAILGKSEGVPGKDLTIRTFGYDLDELAIQSNKVRDAVAGIGGVKDPQVNLPVHQPTLEIEVDLDKAEEFGIKPGDVRRAAATVLSGVTVGNLFEDQKVFEVVVQGTPETRNSLTNVRELLINPPDGGTPVRLDDVANVEIVSMPSAIRHEAVLRSVDVGIDVSGRDIDAVAKDVKATLLGLTFPIEYHAELLDDYEGRQASQMNFLAVSALALLGIFLLLQAASGSWRMAYVMFLALPAALSGGVLAALIDGDLVTIGTLVGFLAVFGFAARHSMLFIHRCHELEDQAGDGEVRSRVVRRAAQERLAPTLTAVATTALTLIPLLFFGGQAGLEIVHPMVAVVLGGLVTSTALTLFVVPALYLRFGARSQASREQIDLFTDLSVVERIEATEAPSVRRTVDA
jgi:Cu/Ag efflux pump CusA